MTEQTEAERIAQDFVDAVIVERNRSRAIWLDDLTAGKQPLFLYSLLAEHFGSLAETINGNAADGAVASADLLLERIVVMSGVACSLYELVTRCRQQYIELDDLGVEDEG
jgi:hypothetical protein